MAGAGGYAPAILYPEDHMRKRLTKVRRRGEWRWVLKRDIRDCWIGVFWDRPLGSAIDLEVFIVLVPCHPIHFWRVRDEHRL